MGYTVYGYGLCYSNSVPTAALGTAVRELELVRPPWASAHRVKWGQLTPEKVYEKLKRENTQKEQFSMFMLHFESNQGRQV